MRVTSCGIRPSALLTRFCTFTAAMSGFVPCLKYTCIVALPELVAVDVMYVMFSTPFILSSRGTITAFITASAFAPVYVVLTTIVGGAMSGYCSIGSVARLIAPSSRIIMAIDIAITGLLINILFFICIILPQNYFTF